ncbi:hypothetical protein, partial [Enterobacter intestinihominis]
HLLQPQHGIPHICWVVVGSEIFIRDRTRVAAASRSGFVLAVVGLFFLAVLVELRGFRQTMLVG